MKAVKFLNLFKHIDGAKKVGQGKKIVINKKMVTTKT